MSNHNESLGIIQQGADTWVIRFERRYAHDRRKVWRAITESEHLAHWMPCDIVGERRAGATIDLPFWPDHVARYKIETPLLHGKINVWDPPSRFEWTWDTDVLRWELDEVDGGTRLTFTTWVAPDEKGTVSAASGYHVCLDHLEMLLDTGSATPLIDADTGPLEARYREQIATAD